LHWLHPPDVSSGAPSLIGAPKTAVDTPGASGRSRPSASLVYELGAALHGTGHTMRVVIEVDIGMHLAGVQPGALVVAYADEAQTWLRGDRARQ
jgi:hypothetical protein